jgi:hypothetical protein
MGTLVEKATNAARTIICTAYGSPPPVRNCALGGDDNQTPAIITYLISTYSSMP